MNPPAHNVFSSRRARLRRKFSGHKIDALLLFNLSNVFYLTGFNGSDGALLLTSSFTKLFVDGRYTEQANRQARNIKVTEYKDKIQGIACAIRQSRFKRIGFDADYLTFETYKKIAARLDKIILTPLSDELQLLRACKDKTEINLMKKAAQIASGAIFSLLGEIKQGVSERDLALQLEFNARKLGADKAAFEPIIASGKNAAFPHAHPTNKKIRSGDFIVIDFGVKYKEYCSDETCTVAFGKLTNKQKHAYQAVKDAHDRAIAAVKSKIEASAVDGCARNAFSEKYRPYFVHGTGHGIGLEVHEAPRLAPNSHDILDSQMVVTVEPGLYFPGQWGIRIEDTVLIKENGCEKLTKMDKGLIILE
ncbi:MAG TPA: Xaa-Pro peptidase family protein [Smithellaceae bacterium]|nr:Xaa-Pro peptidase family protein [Smithellaceae bacterium]HRS90309.1 Xaa-Pro peptidase family protein [Smithellaceae bacterium]HRV27109.1 Xaa-Pro peptidase family protein [Smithellaceae bacterium]